MIRPATKADTARIAELMSVNRSEPVTPEALEKFDERLVGSGTTRMFVLEEGGQIVAFGRSLRMPDDPEGRRKFLIATDPNYRKRGLGNKIYEALYEEGIIDIRADVREDDPASLRFAKIRGFEIIDRFNESILYLQKIDDSEYDALIACAEAQGVRFFPFSETAMDETAQRELWSVNEEVAAEQPGADPDVLSFEAWRQMVANAQWFNPEAQIVAAVGDEWIGLGAVGEMTPGGYYNLFTGVRAPHRGKGIATALKALGIRYAKGKGGRVLRTNNHEQNAAMLAINRRLGYESLPGWYGLKKEIELAS